MRLLLRKKQCQVIPSRRSGICIRDPDAGRRAARTRSRTEHMEHVVHLALCCVCVGGVGGAVVGVHMNNSSVGLLHGGHQGQAGCGCTTQTNVCTSRRRRSRRDPKWITDICGDYRGEIKKQQWSSTDTLNPPIPTPPPSS